MSGRVASALLPDPEGPWSFRGHYIRIYDPSSCSALRGGRTLGWTLYGALVLEAQLNDVDVGRRLGRLADAVKQPGGFDLLVAASGPNSEMAMRALFPGAFNDPPVEFRYELPPGPTRAIFGGDTFCDGP